MGFLLNRVGQMPASSLFYLIIDCACIAGNKTRFQIKDQGPALVYCCKF